MQVSASAFAGGLQDGDLRFSYATPRQQLLLAGVQNTPHTAEMAEQLATQIHRRCAGSAPAQKNGQQFGITQGAGAESAHGEARQQAEAGSG